MKLHKNSYYFLEIVKNNKKYFYLWGNPRSEWFSTPLTRLSRPITQHIKAYINKQLLNNCTLTVDDVSRHDLMRRLVVLLLQGKWCDKIIIVAKSAMLKDYTNLKLFMDFSTWKATHFFIPRVIKWISSEVNYVPVDTNKKLWTKLV